VSRSRLRARADRVNRECDLGELLQGYGYAVVPDRQREQQFSCDLHGMHNKPSARLYGHNNTTYCWVCQKKRDPISYVMEKENFNFVQAVDDLERRLALAPLPWDDDMDAAVRAPDPGDELDDIARHDATYDMERERVRTFLDALTAEREADAKSLLSFWEVFDRIDYGVARQDWGEGKGLAALQQLRARLMDRLRKAVGA